MTQPDADDGEDERSSPPTDDERPRRGTSGIRLDFVLRPLTDLLGGVVGVDLSRPADVPRRMGEGHRPNAASGRRSSGQRDMGARGERRGFHADVRRTDDEVVVVADLPGVDEDDLSVGLNEQRRTLAIAVRGRTVERVSLPWPSVVVSRVWFNNGVLEVRVRASADGPESE